MSYMQSLQALSPQALGYIYNRRLPRKKNISGLGFCVWYTGRFFTYNSIPEKVSQINARAYSLLLSRAWWGHRHDFPVAAPPTPPASQRL